jgi:hypothetical protein
MTRAMQGIENNKSTWCGLTKISHTREQQNHSSTQDLLIVEKENWHSKIKRTSNPTKRTNKHAKRTKNYAKRIKSPICKIQVEEREATNLQSSSMN